MKGPENLFYYTCTFYWILNTSLILITFLLLSLIRTNITFMSNRKQNNPRISGILITAVLATNTLILGHFLQKFFCMPHDVHISDISQRLGASFLIHRAVEIRMLGLKHKKWISVDNHQKQLVMLVLNSTN